MAISPHIVPHPVLDRGTAQRLADLSRRVHILESTYGYIGAGAIGGDKVGPIDGTNGVIPGSITTPSLAPGSVTTPIVANVAIKSQHIDVGQVQTPHIGTGQVVGSHIGAGQVNGTHIAANSISSGHISANSINANHIQANTIQAGHIQANAIQAQHITAGSINTGHIQAGAINAGHIQANAIQSQHITANAINAGHIAANAITAGAIAANAITTDKIAAGAVTANTIAAGAVTAGTIAAGAVTATSLAAGSVTATSIAANAITAAGISAGAVVTAALAAGSVTTQILAAGSVTATTIAAGAVTAGAIAAGAVTATNISSTALSSYIFSGNNVTLAASGTSSSKVLLDNTGITTYDAGGNQLSSISATDGSINVVNGTITGGIIQTSGSALGTAGTSKVMLDSTGLKAYDVIGNNTVSIDTSGLLTVSKGTITGAVIQTGGSAVGTTSASKVMLDSNGLKAFNAAAIVTVSIDLGGNLTATGGTITGAVIQTSGSTTGSASAGKVMLDSAGLSAYNAAAVRTVFIDTGGNLTVSQGTITGAVVQTGGNAVGSVSASKVMLDSTGLKAYDAAANNTVSISTGGVLTVTRGSITLSDAVPAGTGARVTLDSTGIKGFNSSNTQQFGLDATTGLITATGVITANPGSTVPWNTTGFFIGGGNLVYNASAEDPTNTLQSIYLTNPNVSTGYFALSYGNYFPGVSIPGNYNFETANSIAGWVVAIPTNWWLNNGGTITQQSTTVHSGTYAGQVSTTGTVWAQGTALNLGVLPAGYYGAYLWTLVPAGQSMQVFGGQDSAAGIDAAFTGTGAWQQVFVSFPSDGVITSYLGLRTGTAAAMTFYVDDPYVMYAIPYNGTAAQAYQFLTNTIPANLGLSYTTNGGPLPTPINVNFIGTGNVAGASLLTPWYDYLPGGSSRTDIVPPGWVGSGAGVGTFTYSQAYHGGNVFKLTTQGGGWCYMDQRIGPFGFVPGTKYTLSAYFRAPIAQRSPLIELIWTDASNRGIAYKSGQATWQTASDKWQRLILTDVVPPKYTSQSITIGGSPTAGSFTLTYNGQTTAPIPYNATAAQVRDALRLLTTIGSTGVGYNYGAVDGGPLPGTPIYVPFALASRGQGSAQDPSGQMTANISGLTGGTPSISIVDVPMNYVDMQCNVPTGAVGEVFYVDGVQFQVGDAPTDFSPRPDEILANKIQANMINVSQLSALTANLGTVSAGTLNAVTLNASTFNAGSLSGTSIQVPAVNPKFIVDTLGNVTATSFTAQSSVPGSVIQNGTVTAGKLSITTGGKNLLQDSSFENSSVGTGPYQPSGVSWFSHDVNATIRNASTYNGVVVPGVLPGNGNYMEVAYTTASASPFEYVQLTGPSLTSVLGRTVTASAYVYKPANSPANANDYIFALYDNVHPMTGVLWSQVNTFGSWVRVSATLTVDPTATLLQLRLYAPYAAGVNLFDAIQVELGDTPTAWSQNISATVIDGGNITAANITGSTITGGTVQTSTASNVSKVVIDGSGLRAYNSGGSNTVNIGADGSLTVNNVGSITGATITGSVVQTASSGGSRVVLNSSGIYAYNSGGSVTVSIGTDGSFSSSGTSNITGATITGGVIQTAATGNYIRMDTTPTISVYRSGTKLITMDPTNGLRLTGGGTGGMSPYNYIDWFNTGIDVGGQLLASVGGQYLSGAQNQIYAISYNMSNPSYYTGLVAVSDNGTNVNNFVQARATNTGGGVYTKRILDGVGNSDFMQTSNLLSEANSQSNAQIARNNLRLTNGGGGAVYFSNSYASGPQTVYHNLPGTPTSIVVTCRDLSGNAVMFETMNRNYSSFDVYGFYTTALTGYVYFDWMAMW